MKRLRIRHVVGTVLCVLAASGTARAQWTINGTDVYYTGGHVGMGTSNPAFFVHAVESSTTNGARAIYGLASGASGVVNGVYGHTTSTDGRGVIGFASSTTGVNFGVIGTTDSTSGRGVFGLAGTTSGTNYGVYAQSNSSAGFGVYALANSASGVCRGVLGESVSSTGVGVQGVASHTTGQNIGVVGQTDSNHAAAFGVYAFGNIGASGTKPFCIDHPSDPANKYLFHYATESPEVLNAYSGKVVLNGAGAAVVEMPAYFASVNRDPRYTLTAVGAPMPLLHIVEEISEAALADGAKAEPGEDVPLCHFRIAGGAPGGKVSWRIEAVRNDRWVRSRGAPVEVEKEGAARGTYLQPELFGMPKDLGTFNQAGPATVRTPRQER